MGTAGSHGDLPQQQDEWRSNSSFCTFRGWTRRFVTVQDPPVIPLFPMTKPKVMCPRRCSCTTSSSRCAWEGHRAARVHHRFGYVVGAACDRHPEDVIVFLKKQGGHCRHPCPTTGAP